MRHAPADVSDAAVLAVVRDRWWREADRVVHLPVGFGAWHWQALAAGRPVLFLTLDRLGVHHSGDTLEAAYAGAAELAWRGLDFVVPPLPGPDDRFTAGLGPYALSASVWHEGSSGDGPFPDHAEAERTSGMLAAIHAQAPPTGIPRWHPLVGPDFPDLLAARTLSPWTSGPHGETARLALRERLDEIGHWTADYLRLAASTDPEAWVATHGEPHTRNLLVSGDRTYLVDWESLRLAPQERDLRYLVPHGLSGDADDSLVTMFDLEWRLDEVSQYADWFEGYHRDSADERIALDGLRHELTRPALG